MDFHPDFLTMEEEKAPYESIRNFFKGQDLFDVKDKLERWCLTAISYYMERVIIDRHSLIGIFEQLNKVIEVSFIITEVRELKAQAKREEEAGHREL